MRALFSSMCSLIIVVLASLTWVPRVTGQAPEFVVSGFVGGIAVYRVNTADGTLSSVAGSPFSLPWATGVASDPKGQFIYAANPASNSVSAYSLDPSTGALAAVPGSPFAAGANP